MAHPDFREHLLRIMTDIAPEQPELAVDTTIALFRESFAEPNVYLRAQQDAASFSTEENPSPEEAWRAFMSALMFHAGVIDSVDLQKRFNPLALSRCPHCRKVFTLQTPSDDGVCPFCGENVHE